MVDVLLRGSAWGARARRDTWDTAAGGRTLGRLSPLSGDPISIPGLDLSPLLASRSRELGPATLHIEYYSGSKSVIWCSEGKTVEGNNRIVDF